MLLHDNYLVLCDPSQKGFVDDLPHRHSQISDGLVSVPTFISFRMNVPVIFNGPDSVTSIIACDFFPSMI